MSIRFQAFRQMLLGLITIISLASIVLSSCLFPYFVHRKIFWMIIVIESGCLMRSFWSGIRKPFLKQYQSVASENIELFILLPFKLILALVILTLPMVHGSTGRIMPAALETLIIVNATINTGYTICLFVVAMLTAPAYDVDVWVRDIDSSPSPFPVSIVLSFIFPCVSRCSPTSAQGINDDLREVPLPPCLPGCNCSCAVKSIAPMVSLAALSEGQLAASSSHQFAQIQIPTGSRIPLHQSLVRIPDAAERRASIIIAFDV